MSLPKRPIIFLFFFVILCIPFTGKTQPALVFQNVLQRFTSDGCSRFPDGIPVFKPDLWLNCCVDHDIAYWQGGTAEQRSEADEKLRLCVNKSTDSKLGNDMWIGVRLGGFVGLPTSWHWGYGWMINRGYSPLNVDEKAQVEMLIKEIPADYSKLNIEDSFLVRDRLSVTGNYCLDQALLAIQSEQQHALKVTRLLKKAYLKAGEFYENYEIYLEGCEAPYKIDFQLLRADACVTQQNELMARGRIRLREFPSSKPEFVLTKINLRVYPLICGPPFLEDN